MTACSFSPRDSEGISSEFRPYVLILCALRGRQLTIREVQRWTELSYGSLRHMLPHLRASRLIGVKGWKVDGRATMPVYGLGADTADKLPPLRSPLATCIALASLLKELERPCTVLDLSEATGVGVGAVQRFMRICATHRLAYVAEWAPVLGAFKRAPAWRLGNHADARPPAPVPRIEINRRHEVVRALRREHLRIVHATAGIPRQEPA